MKNFQFLIIFYSYWQFIQAQDFGYGAATSDWPDTCSSGEMQSPINFQDVKNTCDNKMVLNLNFVTSETQIKFNKTLYSEGSFGSLYATDIDGNLLGYNITRIEVHAPSEHQIEGSNFDLELQLQAQIKTEFDSDTITYKYAYIVLLHLVNDSNPSSTFFQTWDVTQLKKDIKISLNDILANQFDENGQYMLYQGSQTQPPCNEEVSFYVYQNPISISTLQLKAVNQYFSGDLSFAGGNGNNRPVMPLGDRTIKMGNIQCEEQFIYFFSFFILYVFINYFIFKLL